MIRALKDHGFHAPCLFKELTKLPDDIIGMGCKMGEGWLLTAEMIELVRSGYGNIVWSPSGPAQICERVDDPRPLPGGQHHPIDYDPGHPRRTASS